PPPGVEGRCLEDSPAAPLPRLSHPPSSSRLNPSSEAEISVATRTALEPPSGIEARFLEGASSAALLPLAHPPALSLLNPGSAAEVAVAIRSSLAPPHDIQARSLEDASSSRLSNAPRPSLIRSEIRGEDKAVVHAAPALTSPAAEEALSAGDLASLASTPASAIRVNAARAKAIAVRALPPETIVPVPVTPRQDGVN